MGVDTMDVSVNAWTHLALAMNGSSGWIMYVNGVATNTVDRPGWHIQNKAPFRIGGSGNCKPFVGDIEEVSLYDRALSENEVRALYRAGRNA